MGKILYLPLKAKWYEMIESGEKTEEYRDIKDYWTKRIIRNGVRSINCQALPTLITDVVFTYGYTHRKMRFKVKRILIGKGFIVWGAPYDRVVYIIKLGNRIY